MCSLSTWKFRLRNNLRADIGKQIVNQLSIWLSWFNLKLSWIWMKIGWKNSGKHLKSQPDFTVSMNMINRRVKEEDDNIFGKTVILSILRVNMMMIQMLNPNLMEKFSVSINCLNLKLFIEIGLSHLVKQSNLKNDFWFDECWDWAFDLTVFLRSNCQSQSVINITSFGRRLIKQLI